jgi:hypothetical protein
MTTDATGIALVDNFRSPLRFKSPLQQELCP